MELQRTELHDYCKRAGYTDVETYTDVVSGTKAKREGLDRLLLAVNEHRVQAVVILRLDRLARSVKHLSELAAVFEDRKVALIVTAQAIDTSSIGGRLLFNVLASIAEFEHGLIRERVMEGQARAMRKGVRFGPKPILDKRKVARAKRLKANGKSISAIARHLECARGTVRRAVAS